MTIFAWDHHRFAQVILVDLRRRAAGESVHLAVDPFRTGPTWASRRGVQVEQPCFRTASCRVDAVRLSAIAIVPAPLRSRLADAR